MAAYQPTAASEMTTVNPQALTMSFATLADDTHYPTPPLSTAIPSGNGLIHNDAYVDPYTASWDENDGLQPQKTINVHDRDNTAQKQTKDQKAEAEGCKLGVGEGTMRKQSITVCGQQTEVYVYNHTHKKTHQQSPAVFHHDIRGHLQREAAATNPAYIEPRPKGGDSDDVTAQHDFSHTWKEHDWSTIANEVLYKMQRQDFEGPFDKSPYKEWKWHGLLVLNKAGEAMRVLDSLPVTISSQTRGWLLEAWKRNDKRITKNDIMARLPATYMKNGNRTALYTLNNLSNKINRSFLDNHGLPTWNPRANEVLKQRFKMSRIPAQYAGSNDTRHLPQMTKEVQKIIASIHDKNAAGKSRHRKENERRGIIKEQQQAKGTLRLETWEEIMAQYISVTTPNMSGYGPVNINNTQAASGDELHGRNLLPPHTPTQPHWDASAGDQITETPRNLDLSQHNEEAPYLRQDTFEMLHAQTNQYNDQYIDYLRATSNQSTSTLPQTTGVNDMSSRGADVGDGHTPTQLPTESQVGSVVDITQSLDQNELGKTPVADSEIMKAMAASFGGSPEDEMERIDGLMYKYRDEFHELAKACGQNGVSATSSVPNLQGKNDTKGATDVSNVDASALSMTSGFSHTQSLSSTVSNPLLAPSSAKTTLGKRRRDEEEPGDSGYETSGDQTDIEAPKKKPRTGLLAPYKYEPSEDYRYRLYLEPAATTEESPNSQKVPNAKEVSNTKEVTSTKQSFISSTLGKRSRDTYTAVESDDFTTGHFTGEPVSKKTRFGGPELNISIPSLEAPAQPLSTVADPIFIGEEPQLSEIDSLFGDEPEQYNHDNETPISEQLANEGRSFLSRRPADLFEKFAIDSKIENALTLINDRFAAIAYEPVTADLSDNDPDASYAERFAQVEQWYYRQWATAQHMGLTQGSAEYLPCIKTWNSCFEPTKVE